MGVSRRDFLKLSGTTVVLGSLGVNLDPAKAYAKGLRIKGAKQTTTVCPVLLGGLRHHRPHEGRQGGEHRGRSRASDQ